MKVSNKWSLLRMWEIIAKTESDLLFVKACLWKLKLKFIHAGGSYASRYESYQACCNFINAPYLYPVCSNLVSVSQPTTESRFNRTALYFRHPLLLWHLDRAAVKREFATFYLNIPALFLSENVSC